MSKHVDSADVVVVGGGLSGLGTAAYLGRAGLSVTVVERTSRLGGRAATAFHEGYALNRGPHALYRNSDARAVLADLGVSVPGEIAPSSGLALRGGVLHQLPTSPLSLLTTGLLGLRGKATVARFLQRLPHLDTSELGYVSAAAWLERNGIRSDAGALFEALFRLTTYVDAPTLLSAATAVRQLQRAMGGVLYIDGGWQTLVDGLAARVGAFGGSIAVGARVTALTRDTDGVTGVVLGDERTVHARAVVLAVEPQHAAALLESVGAAVPESMRPVPQALMATLDVALDRLPRPDQRFVLGIDRPLYLSVHSGVARVAPEGGSLIHVGKYLGTRESDPDANRGELEGLLDLAQPGWRNGLVHAQYLPRMTAAERLDLAEDGGAAGRPVPTVPSIHGVYVAGDWVQGGSFLADASLGSARAAAQAVAFALERRRNVA